MNNLYLVNDAEGENGWILLVAPSRGSARSMYIAGYLDDCEFTEPLTIQLLAHDIQPVDSHADGGECMWGADEVYFETLDEGWILRQWRDDIEQGRRYPQQRALETFYAG